MTVTTPIHPSSVFLVSGGGRGITAECTIKIAEYHKCKFILLGRSVLLQSEPDFAQDCFEESELKKRIMEYKVSQGEKPTPKSLNKVFKQISSSREIKNTLTRLQEKGAEAEYLSVDVTDKQSLQQKVITTAQKFGSITGIMHGAGTLADKFIDKKTDKDFESVYKAKVCGLENLLSCVDLYQLEHLILFSSSSGFYGNVGQTDYALANEILNKSAHLVKQRNPKSHVVAFNWGPWDKGMVTPALKKVFEERNIGIIPIAVGTEILTNQMNHGDRDTAQVVVGSPAVHAPLDFKPELQTYSIRRQLTLEANPFLQDHVIAGSPVLPATCAISWMINACENLYPGYRLASFQDFKVLKGIVFDGNQAKEYILELQEVVKNRDEIVFKAKIWSKNSVGTVRYHFSLDLKLCREIQDSPIYQWDDSPTEITFSEQGQDFYQSRFDGLFHGSSFWGVDKVLSFSQEKITAKCLWHRIEARKQGQFREQWFNPYTADITFHPFGIWLQHFYQRSALPAYIEKYEQFATTPVNSPFFVTLEAKGGTNTAAIFDAVVHNLEGQVYSRFSGIKGVILY